VAVGGLCLERDVVAELGGVGLSLVLERLLISSAAEMNWGPSER
jgi:hypothetical protein